MEDWRLDVGNLDDPPLQALIRLVSTSGPWHAILHTGLLFKVNRTIRPGLTLPCAPLGPLVTATPAITPTPTEDHTPPIASSRPRRTRSLGTRKAAEAVAGSLLKQRVQKKRLGVKKDRLGEMSGEGAPLLRSLHDALPQVIEKGQIDALESILSAVLSQANIPLLSQIAPLFQQSIQV